MTQRFLNFIGFVIDHEGTAWENDPDDPGNFTPSGELKGTRYGIDARSHPDEDIRNMTLERAKEIYFEEYWDKNECESLPAKIGECHFDACVNCGAGRAKKFLAEPNAMVFPDSYLNARAKFYRSLAESRPKLRKFLKGWLNRVEDLRRYLKSQN